MHVLAKSALEIFKDDDEASGAVISQIIGFPDNNWLGQRWPNIGTTSDVGPTLAPQNMLSECVQKRCNSSGLTMNLQLFCINP